MLRFLRIRNLAVIESVEVEFDKGFNVMTGETGAGKSILVEAVGLLLGARASSDLVRTGESQASIEAIFEVGGEELIVRREITVQGRSRSFVNGALATAAALRDLSHSLVELHGQHEHQALLDPLTHLPLLDSYGGHEALGDRVQSAWAVLSAARDRLNRAGMDVRERDARVELIAFQLGEIERVAPKAQEDDDLAVTRQVLSSAGRIQRLCDESYSELYDSDGAVLGALSTVRKRVAELAGIEPQFEPYLAASDAIKSQLEDMAWFIRDYGGRIDASPERLQQVEERLASVERLKRKYGPTLDDVLEKWALLRTERELLSGVGERSEEIQAEVDTATAEYLRHARQLSETRRAGATRFARDLERLLAELAMAKSRFEVRFENTDAAPDTWSARGIDQAEFFLSPNPGEDLRPLARIVSGGELSRVMLALKTLAARIDAIRQRSGPGASDGEGKTLIFDEVDAGIGGQVADVVGTRLQDLGTDFQVLCITHLPQIAVRGATQFQITKTVTGGRTTTTVRRLTPDERVDEVARMIGGTAISAAVRASAQEMLRRAAPVPRKAKGESESPARGESESRRRPR